MRKGWYWPPLLGALLVAGVGANVLLMVVATGDPSFAVEPDYYAKAVDWDARRALVERSGALGWKASIAVGPADRATGLATVAVRLADRDGNAISGAAVEIEAFHNGRASNVLRAALAEQAGATYAARLPVVRPGLWELRLTAHRGADTFVTALEHEVLAR